MGFFKDLMKPLDNLTHSAGKGFENIMGGWASAQKSMFGGMGSIMKGLGNPIVLIGIAGVVAFVIMRKF